MLPVVAALHSYPVKSLRGHEVESIEIERCGPKGDRRWLVVTPDGGFMTQRQHPAMACIDVREQGTGLVLSAPGQGSVTVQVSGSERLQVTVWKSTVPALMADPEADVFLTAALGLTCRLAYLDDPEARTVDPGYSDPEDRVSFADGFPVLIAGLASLEDLNTRMDASVPMNRFRPNIVVQGSEAWAEDGWRRVRIGEAVFRVVKPCSRCIMTTVDQETGHQPDPKEPLRTLAKFRRGRGGVMFGQNLVPERLGRIAVGDPVEIIETGPSNLDA